MPRLTCPGPSVGRPVCSSAEPVRFPSACRPSSSASAGYWPAAGQTDVWGQKQEIYLIKGGFRPSICTALVFCPEDILYATKLGMMVHHPDAECHAKRLGCYLQGQAHSEGSNDGRFHASTLTTFIAT